MTDTLTKTGPSINKGRSRQDYSTPWIFIHAVEKRFGKIDCDLAASDANAKAPHYYTEERDSLTVSWASMWGGSALHAPSLLYLNPPYANITPWVRKCYVASMHGAHILLLVPASVGSNWFADYVHEKARVLFLRPRLTFEGASDPYPKDLMLCHYQSNILFDGGWYECWRWK